METILSLKTHVTLAFDEVSFTPPLSNQKKKNNQKVFVHAVILYVRQKKSILNIIIVRLTMKEKCTILTTIYGETNKECSLDLWNNMQSPK